MDDRRFDDLVKSLAAGGSRRRVLRGMLGLGAAAGMGRLARDENEAAAARRPSPSPTAPACPGQQRRVGNACICTVPPAAGTQTCGPDCCNPTGAGAAHSECCDNSCCFGTCYGEELCCPTNLPANGGAPAAQFCTNGECCLAPKECCGGSTCCLSGQCTNSGTCCGENEIVCGDICCSGPHGRCASPGVCVCDLGYTECYGVCGPWECCGTETGDCVELGFDADCVACSSGVCSPTNQGLSCNDGQGTCLDGNCAV